MTRADGHGRVFSRHKDSGRIPRTPTSFTQSRLRGQLTEERPKCFLHHVRIEWAYLAVTNLTFPIDDEGFRNTINAPVDADATKFVRAYALVGIAELGKPLNGVERLVPIVDAIDLDCRVFGPNLRRNRGLFLLGPGPEAEPQRGSLGPDQQAGAGV